MIVWALTDERIGSNNQSIALAERLSKYYVIKKVVYNSLIKLPNFIRNSSLLGINKKLTDNINSDLPDVVICAGRRLSSVALNIKKRSNNRTFIINIMDPNLPCAKFNTLLLPKHDKISKKKAAKPFVIETNGSLSRVKTEIIEQEVQKWQSFFENYEKPLISLIIGGDTKNYKYNPKEFGKMIANISDITNKMSGTLLVTTSRRTSNQCVEEIRKKLNCDYFLYDWKWENDPRNLMKNKLGNPYFAFLGLSDFLVVTGDSMSMVSEACSTGRPTYVYMPKNSLSKKHLRFCQEMEKQNYIREFDKNTIYLRKYNYKPLNELNRVVKIINEKLKNRK